MMVGERGFQTRIALTGNGGFPRFFAGLLGLCATLVCTCPVPAFLPALFTALGGYWSYPPEVYLTSKRLQAHPFIAF
jgi:hypothetical protein